MEELSAAMVELLNDPEKGRQLAERARAKIEAEYSHLAAAEKYEQIYLGAK